MSFRGDRRGQSVQIGAVLLFATIVIAFSLYQATVVPAENQRIEYAAYEDASRDLTTLRNAMISVAGGDGTRGVSVKTGAQYPPRVFFMNPLQPSGTVSTTAAANVTLGNVSATGSEFTNVGEYLSVEGGTLNYTTRNVRFDPDYKELSAAPIIINNGLVYRNHSNPTPLAAQTFIRGNTITLQTVVGDLDASGYEAPVTVVPVSAHTNTVSVTNASTGDLTVTVPTRRSASEWENTILAGETGNYVADVRPGPRPNTVTVEMVPGETYELRLARLELTERNDDGTAEDLPARYVVSETDRRLTTNSDGRVKLSVEARDALNNPVSNSRVTFSASSGKFETAAGQNLSASATVRTNGDGTASVYYNATDYVGNLPVTARLGSGGAVPPEKRVEYRVTNTVVSGNSESGSGTNINPGDYVVLDSAQIIRADSGLDEERVNVTFENQGVTDANITAMRFSFYFEDNNNGPIISSTVYNESGSQVFELPVRGRFTELPYNATVPANNGTVSFEYAFDIDYGGGDVRDYSPDDQTDFFIVEVVYNDASAATYFVGFEPKT